MASVHGAQTWSRTVRCPVELHDVSGVRAGFTTLVDPAGVHVQLSLEEGERLCAGTVVEVIASAPPIGPFRATARVTSVQAGRDGQGAPVLSTALTFEALGENQQRALTQRLLAVRPLIVTRGLATLDSADWCDIVQATGEEDLLRLLAEQEVAVVVLGPDASSEEAHRILSRYASTARSATPAFILAGVPEAPDSLEVLLVHKHLFYLSHRPLTAAHLSALISAAASRTPIRRPSHPSAMLRGMPAELLDLCTRIASETEITQIGYLVVDAVRSVVAANSVEYLSYDAVTNRLVAHDPDDLSECSVSAARGLLGYVTKTGERLDTFPAGLDPRTDRDTDGVSENEQVRLLAEPIVDQFGQVLGVVVLRLSPSAQPVSAREAAVLELIGAYAAAALSVRLLWRESRTEMLQGLGVIADPEIYRTEALEQALNDKAGAGTLLAHTPRWLTRMPLFAAMLFVASLGAMSIVRVDDYVSAPAVIQARSKIDVVARRSGTVRSVEASVGDRVTAGDLLIRLVETPGVVEGDRFVEQVWATGEGVVGELRVRAGQPISQGDVVATIVDDRAGVELIAFVPGHQAPRLDAGIPLVLRLHGYPGTQEDLRAEHVDAQILGSAEALRYAGRTASSGLTLSGPTVIVRCALQSQRFTYDGSQYRFHDGMTGDVDVSVGSVPLIVTLLRSMMPGL